MEKNIKRVMVITLIAMVVLFGGISYAYLRVIKTQTGDNEISTVNCLDISLTNISESIDSNYTIKIVNAFPISDAEGLATTPYIFKIKNTCSNTYVSANINLESLNLSSTTSLALNQLKVGFGKRGKTQRTWLIDNLGNETSTIVGSTSKRLKTIKLAPNDEQEYEFRLWVDYDTDITAMGKTYQGKIVVVATAIPKEDVIPNSWDNPAHGTLLYAIKNDPKNVIQKGSRPGRDISSPLFADATATGDQTVPTELRSKYITYATGYTDNNDNTITLTGVQTGIYSSVYSSLVNKYVVTSWLEDNFSDTSEAINTTNVEQIVQVTTANASSMNFKVGMVSSPEAILASTTDDFGTSYYFRGAVENNYVVFAKMCWRIVRIDGLGNIKLVLYNYNSDKENVTNPCASTYDSRYAAFVRYSGDIYTSTFNSSGAANAYVGLMYGSTSTSATYEETHANINKSTILTNLETWYDNNLADYENKLADVIWCNDKSFGSTNTGTGVGRSKTYYGAYGRLYNVSTASPTLVCPDASTSNNNYKNISRFTVDEDAYGGNGALDKPIGLLTADEIAFAGGIYGVSNSSYYLNKNASGNWWWSASPFNFNGQSAYVWRVGWDGYLSYIYVGYDNVLRPAVSLTSYVKVTSTAGATGDFGTSENPYVIVA